MSEEKQPFDEQPQESASEPYQPVEDYTPPTAEPPAEMSDTTPAPELFAPPSIDASSFPGGEAASSGQVEQPAAPPPAEPFTPSPTPQTGGTVPPPPGAPAAKGSLKWWVILLIVLAVLCCCCVVVVAVILAFVPVQEMFNFSQLLRLLPA
ncbi:hypothetical protein ATHL_00264 [Anaerolinea thermolimosa]|uniref:hypothetical protein n=1 Tax=Anaerolinea thermolimosa TaxID=229919 RepID=UPI0007841BB9|nr:hypothetical protein [Anaerolinea thermolimosa]GAP05433.1 hypothetical protein ATHL_00264 [Anaerolinea thermolimosa]